MSDFVHRKFFLLNKAVLIRFIHVFKNLQKMPFVILINHKRHEHSYLFIMDAENKVNLYF